MQTKIVQLQGDQLTVEADKLLCYDSGLQAGTMFLGQQGGLRSIVQGQMTGQGLFTTQLTGHGQAVLLSHGPRVRAPGRAARRSRSTRRPTSATRA